MKNVQESLMNYRRTKLQTATPIEEVSQDTQKIVDENISPAPTNQQFRFYDYLAVDLLNVYPMRKWREFCAAFPMQCWTFTISIWLVGQIIFAKVEFGLVYFMLSLFILMFLNLGVRKEGQLSAYSVFNPNCERLLGQMTSDHFERDMLMRKQRDEHQS